jgi:hypothetical protein
MRDRIGKRSVRMSPDASPAAAKGMNYPQF